MVRDFFMGMEKDLNNRFKREKKQINDAAISEAIMEYLRCKGFSKNDKSVQKENHMFKANGSMSRSQIGSKSIDIKRKRSVDMKPVSIKTSNSQDQSELMTLFLRNQEKIMDY